MKKIWIACTFVSMMLAASACSSVRHPFIVKGYTKNPAGMIKRIVVFVEPSAGTTDLASLIGAMTRDVIKTNRNYLVYGIFSTEHKMSEACQNRDGVLRMRVNQAEVAGERVNLEIAGELRRCSDGSVVWSASARSSGKSRNRSLENLIRSYVEEHGKHAEIYAAPAFHIIEDIVETMPNPMLTEDELFEKIDLEN